MFGYWCSPDADFLLYRIRRVGQLYGPQLVEECARPLYCSLVGWFKLIQPLECLNAAGLQCAFNDLR